MNYYNFLLGPLLVIGGMLILIIQWNNGQYKKGLLNNGVVHLTFGGVFAILGGLYLIISSL
jgi:hypothetical protein